MLSVVEMRGCRERELSEIEPEQKRVGGAASFLERGIWSRDALWACLRHRACDVRKWFMTYVIDQMHRRETSDSPTREEIHVS